MFRMLLFPLYVSLDSVAQRATLDQLSNPSVIRGLRVFS